MMTTEAGADINRATYDATFTSLHHALAKVCIIIIIIIILITIIIIIIIKIIIIIIIIRSSNRPLLHRHTSDAVQRQAQRHRSEWIDGRMDGCVN